MPKRSSRHQLPSSHASPSIPSTFTDSLSLPSLIVFDLDYTLWPFWVDTHVSSPVRPAISATSANPSGLAQINTKMLDRWGESYTFYSDVPGILAAARDKNIVMSLASRTHAPELAGEMLRGLQIPNNAHTVGEAAEGEKDSKPQKPLRAWDFFTHPQIYPGSKTTHFRKLQQQLAKPSKNTHNQNPLQGRTIPFEDMLFFDDEGRNRNVETELGVTFCLVLDGVDCNEVDRGVWAWRKRRGITAPKEGQGVAELEG